MGHPESILSVAFPFNIRHNGVPRSILSFVDTWEWIGHFAPGEMGWIWCKHTPSKMVTLFASHAAQTLKAKLLVGGVLQDWLSAMSCYLTKMSTEDPCLPKNTLPPKICLAFWHWAPIERMENAIPELFCKCWSRKLDLCWVDVVFMT